MLDKICEVFLTFVVYSFAGWFFETLLHIVRDRKVVKRGFLFGPLCPIYGCGAILEILILYGRTENVFILFGAGLLISGVTEYTVHFILEKCFHAMWWDYSSRRFNINGRVYLNGLLFMGVGAALFIKYVHPFFLSLEKMIPQKAVYIICFVIYSILIMDIATTIADLKNSVGALKHLLKIAIDESQSLIDNTGEKINGVADNIRNNEKVVELINKVKSEKSPVSKFKNRYPDFNLKKYKPILDMIRDKPVEEKARKDIKLYGEGHDFEDENTETETKKDNKKSESKKK